jgi:hypothetical protein
VEGRHEINGPMFARRRACRCKRDVRLAQSKINDAQIAAIAVAANQVDVDAGKLALSKARNGEIKQFAQTMITDHGGAHQGGDGSRRQAQGDARRRTTPARRS